VNQTQPLLETEQGVLTPRRRSGRTPIPDTELILPGWGQFPASRRHRLVALLGELVRRSRASEDNGNDGG